MNFGSEPLVQFVCWDPDYCDEDYATDGNFRNGYLVELRIDDPETAACTWSERRFGGDDYPESRIVCVRKEGENEVKRFRVYAEQTVSFRAEAEGGVADDGVARLHADLELRRRSDPVRYRTPNCS